MAGPVLLCQIPSHQVGWKPIRGATGHCHSWRQDATSVGSVLTMSVVPVLTQGWGCSMELSSAGLLHWNRQGFPLLDFCVVSFLCLVGLLFP